MKTCLMDKLSESYYKNKPTILVVGGMVGSVVAAYLAWRAGRKHEDVIEEVRNDIQEIRDKRPDPNATEQEPGKLTMGEYRKELTFAYIKGGAKVGKVMGPAIGVELASLAAIGAGFGILDERYTGVVALANAQAKAFRAYRGRCRQIIGEEKEKEIYYGYSEKEVEEPEYEEDGTPALNKRGEPKTHKTKKMVLDEALKQHSMYAQIYDPEFCNELETDPITGDLDDAYNYKVVEDRAKMINMFIYQQKYHMYTMNDIYEIYGLPFKKEGQAAGYHARRNPQTGEITIDMCDEEGFKAKLFPVWYNDDLTGRLKKTYIIDYNCPGNVLGYIDEENEITYGVKIK